MDKIGIQPLTIVTVNQGLQTKDFTWAALGFTIGVKSPVLPLMKAALEDGSSYDLGGGVYVTTKGEVSKYQMN